MTTHALAHSRAPRIAVDGELRCIVALIDTAQISGPGRQLAALATELRSSGVDLRVILLHRAHRPYPAYAEYLTSAGVTHAVVPDRGSLDLSIVVRIRELLRKWSAELIQTHSYRMTFAAVALRLLGDRRPWIGFFHGATAEDRKVRIYHWLDRRLLGAADRIVVMSRLHAGEFARYGARVRVIHNAVIPLTAPATESGLRLPPEIDRSAGIPLIGVVGRLSHEKGVDLFLDACRALAGRGVAFQAVIAGDGPERASLQARCEALGLSDRVFLLGQVTDVRSLYQHLALLVIPSRSEGLPNVLLEAMAADVPAVSTAVGAVPEVLTDPMAGTLVPIGDPEEMANAIDDILRWCRTPPASAARASTARRFSLAERTNSVKRLYDELSGTRHDAIS